MSSIVQENLADVYSLIICIDHVERAFKRDTVSADEYTEVMTRLLSRYAKLIQNTDIESSFQNIDSFVTHYRVNANDGLNRIKLGIPATAEAEELPGERRSTAIKRPGNGRGKALLTVAGNFITFNDGIHLGYRSKSDLHPLLADLATSLNSVTKENFNGRSKVVEWLIRLNQLKSGEQISDDEANQCLIDVENAYQSFQQLLE